MGLVNDGNSQQLLMSLVSVFLILVLNKYFGKKIKNWLFASFWKHAMVEYHTSLKEMKRSHFSFDCNSNKTNKQSLRILEIGAGSGANFEFFPLNSELTVIEPNVFFKPMFHENQRKFPNLKMKKFIITAAEDMKEVEDNSIDVVVSTLVLCSVANVEKTLMEIRRVLVPGGKFYYWEHVHDSAGTWLRFIQSFINPIWRSLCDGCNLNRSIDQTVRSFKGFTEVDQKRFYIPLKKVTWKLVRSHVMGVATK